MEEYQNRAVIELQELDEKINRLNNFIGTEVFRSLSIDEKVRLYLQLEYMAQYVNVLEDRILHF